MLLKLISISIMKPLRRYFDEYNSTLLKISSDLDAFIGRFYLDAFSLDERALLQNVFKALFRTLFRHLFQSILVKVSWTLNKR